MSFLRFNHVFFALMLLAVFSSFVIPRAATPAKAHVQGLFAPVSRPVHRLGAWVTGKASGPRQDPESTATRKRTTDEIIDENQKLRVAVANLTTQLERLRERDAQRARLGPVSNLCQAFAVTGTDPGIGQSLTISGTTRAGDGVRSGQPVIENEANLVGKIDRAGFGGSSVRLITDRGFRLFGAFARVITGDNGRVDFVRLATDPLPVEGAGDGSMLIREFPLRQIHEAQIREGDWVVLNDRDWPDALQGYRVGLVRKIEPSKNPGFAQITVEPERNLSYLHEVMVMVK